MLCGITQFSSAHTTESVSVMGHELTMGVMMKHRNGLVVCLRSEKRVVNSGNVPVQFMPLLEVSANANTQLECEMTAANAMIHWSSDSRTFESLWCMDTVKQVLANIAEYENELSSKQRLRSSIKNQENSDCTREAARQQEPIVLFPNE